MAKKLADMIAGDLLLARGSRIRNWRELLTALELPGIGDYCYMGGAIMARYNLSLCPHVTTHGVWRDGRKKTELLKYPFKFEELEEFLQKAK